METSDRIEALLRRRAYLIDIFPKTVPPKADGRYFAAEKLFRRRADDFARRLADIVLKLYCYYDIVVVSEGYSSEAPEAERLAELIEGRSGGRVDILFPELDSLIAIDPEDLYAVVYDPTEELKELTAALAASEGLFFYEGGISASL